MDSPLDPDGRPVRFGGIAVVTPGLSGTATLRRPGDGSQRGGELGTRQLLEALAQTDAHEQATLELTGLGRRSAPSAGGRGAGGAGSADIVLEVPPPSEKEGQLLLHIAEDGAASWHFPDETPERTGGGQRGRALNVYRIPGDLIAPSPAVQLPGQRGVVTTIASKVFKIIAFPLIEFGARKAGSFFARRFEEAHRHERWRSFSVDDYRSEAIDPLQADDWARLSSGRSLLFLHGTGAMAHSAFGRLDRDVLGELSDRYAGRVFALDHFTLSVDPRENVARALRQLPKDVRLDVDVISHSRGGLVARELVERSPSIRVRIGALVMVGTPNAGTALAQRKNIRWWLDAMTNLAQFIPDNPVTDILATVLTVAKHVAVGAFAGLDGLTSMDPDGGYLRALNVDASPQTKYFGIAADFKAHHGSALRRLHDAAIDVLFWGDANDLVVPTAGVAEIAGLRRFAPTSLVLDAARDVDHSSFFVSEAVTDQLKEWLPG